MSNEKDIKTVFVYQKGFVEGDVGHASTCVCLFVKVVGWCQCVMASRMN